MKKSILLLSIAITVLLICFFGCSALNIYKEGNQSLQRYAGSCQSNLNSCQKTLDEVSKELEERQESKPEYQPDAWLDKSVVGVWRSARSTSDYPYLLILQDNGDCYIAGIKFSWYIKDESLHTSISLDDSAQNLKYSEYRYSTGKNKLYLNDNEYIRITETPDHSQLAMSLVGNWSIEGSSSGDYPDTLLLNANSVGEISHLECLWCIEGNTLYLDTFIEHFSYSISLENGTLYLDNIPYTRR